MMERKVVRQTSGPEENVQPKVAIAGTVYQSHHLQSTVLRLLTHLQNNCERQCTPCDRLSSSSRKKDGRTFFHGHSFQSSTTTALGSHGQFSYRTVRA
jgi:hypothetical protein